MAHMHYKPRYFKPCSRIWCSHTIGENVRAAITALNRVYTSHPFECFSHICTWTSVIHHGHESNGARKRYEAILVQWKGCQCICFQRIMKKLASGWHRTANISTTKNHHHHYVPSVVNRTGVMDLHRSRSCASLIQSLNDIFVHSLMLSVHIVIGLLGPLLPFILPSISNRCTPSPLIICPKY